VSSLPATDLWPDRRRAVLLAADAIEGRSEQEWDQVLALLRNTYSAEAESTDLQVLTVDQLLDLPEPEGEDQLLGPLLTKGHRTILFGDTGDGKTTLALQMLRAFVDEQDFLGWQGAGGKALVIDAEQGLRTAKRRLREAHLEKTDCVDYLRVADGLSLDVDPHQAAELEKLLTKGNYDLVVADPLYKLHRGDSNEERSATDLMRLFDRWREELGFALMLLHHRRKSQQGSRKLSLDDAFGSSAYMRGAEVILGIQRLRPHVSRLAFLKDRDGDLPLGTSWQLLFDRETGFKRDPEDGKKEETAVQKVRSVLEQSPGITYTEIRTSTELSEKSIQNAVRDLGATGEGKPKRWYLPNLEQKELDT
jgi:hypothetical protein